MGRVFVAVGADGWPAADELVRIVDTLGGRFGGCKVLFPGVRVTAVVAKWKAHRIMFHKIMKSEFPESGFAR